MAVAVNNTAADLAGKTLAKLQDAQTIVGLKTFDLGLAAPFAVAAGAAMVANLDAEKVGGETKAQLHDAALLTGALDASVITTGTIANARLSPTIAPTPVALVDATPTLDASLGTIFHLQATGDRTIPVPTNPVGGQKIIIVHFASGADRTLTLTAGAGGFRFGSDVTGLTATVNGRADYIGCIFNNFVAGGIWDVVAYSKGYP